MYPAGAAGLFVNWKRTTRRATVVSQSPYRERKTATKYRVLGPAGGPAEANDESGVTGPVRTGDPDTPSSGVPISTSIATRARFAEGRPLVRL
jgi:hypothetical protein